MSVAGRLRKAVSQRLTPLVGDLEELVFRYGYLRVFFSAVVSLGSVGLLGQILGLAWLRTVFATIAAALFVLASAISFSGTQKLRDKVRKSEAILHRYADALRSSSPVKVREWRQEVTIETNGDAYFQRELILEGAPDDIPRHLSVNLVYYGSTELTERTRRQVQCTALHAGPEDRNAATRANATSTWTTSSNGKPKLDIYVHLGHVVQAGDVVIVEWIWPAYSADLMNGVAPEEFDVLFNKEIGKFEHEVVFRDVGGRNSFKIRNLGAANLVQARQGRDLVVRFSSEEPPMNRRMGFVADYSHDR